MPATEKISITLGREELRHAKRLASQLGLSLSTFVNDAVRQRLEAQARKLAGLEVIAMFPPEDRATPDEMSALLKRWNAPRPNRARRAPGARPRRARNTR